MLLSKTFGLVLVYLFIGISVQQQDLCQGFRITSPTMENLRWTAGQCYQLSYDVASILPFITKGKISVDVYNAETNVKASSAVMEETVNSFGGTKAFNLQAPVSGVYYYLVTFIYGQDETRCEPKRTVSFEVNVNPNSPPAQC